ncbi:MAG: S8 family serine peptidase [Promethearchaeota archaeon]
MKIKHGEKKIEFNLILMTLLISSIILSSNIISIPQANSILYIPKNNLSENKFNQIQISSSDSLQEKNPTNSNLADPELKIDSRLLPKLDQPVLYENYVKLIIVFNPKATSLPQYPKEVHIITQFELFKGQKIECPIGLVHVIAEFPEIRNIWLDTPYKLNPYQDIDVGKVIRSASDSNLDPNFANFTKEIHAPELWNQGYNGSSVVIAVLDTGVDITGSGGGDLDDFDDNSGRTKFLGSVSMVPDEPLYYSDLNGRGTFHAGIACGTGNLNKSYIGVAPGAYYLNVKIYDSLGITYWSFIISGIEWAVSHGADIILFANTIPGLYIDPVCQSINTAVDRGVSVIAPVGDDGPGYMSVNTPGQALKAIRIGTYDSFTNDVWTSSSRGPTFDFARGPDIVAPGVNLIGPRAQLISDQSLDLVKNLASSTGIQTESTNMLWEMMDKNFDAISSTLETFPKSTYGEPLSYNGNYTRASGTGPAAAVVAGAVAILLSAFPMVTPALIHQSIMETATPIHIEQDLNSEGKGLINVEAAFNWLDKYFQTHQDQLSPTSAPLLYPGIVSTKNISIYGDGTLPSNYYQGIQTYDISGVMSSQGMMDMIISTNSSVNPNSNVTMENLTAIHLPLNQFGLCFSLNSSSSEFHWFSEFNVIREMHQCINNIYYADGYKRYSSILELKGLYTVMNLETWSYFGDYSNQSVHINFTNPLTGEPIQSDYDLQQLENVQRVNAFKISFHFINARSDGLIFNNLSLLSYFKADLFLNEDGELANLEENQSLNSLANFTYDDTVGYDESSQILFVSDQNNSTDYVRSDNYASMGFQSLDHNISAYTLGESIRLLANLTVSYEKASDWNYNTQLNASLAGEGHSDPGFAGLYSLGSLAYGTSTTFTGALSLGQSNTTAGAIQSMKDQVSYLKLNVTNYNVTDLMILSSNFSRITEKDQKYDSKVLFMNIGNQIVDNSQLGFIVNRSNSPDQYHIQSAIFNLHNIQPFKLYEMNASWVPLSTGIFVVGWVIGDLDQIMEGMYTSYSDIQIANPFELAQNLGDVNLLSNVLARTVFVVDGSFYEQQKYSLFTAFPDKLDQNPMKIYAPMDYAIYNLTVFAIHPMADIHILCDGIGSNLAVFLDPKLNLSSQNPFSKISIRNLDSYTSIPFIIFGNPLTPPGIINFNITFSRVNENGQLYVFYRIPVELHFSANRGRIWFDCVHLNMFVSPNIVGSGSLDSFFYTNDQADQNETPISTIPGFNQTFGNFNDIDSMQLDTSQGFDITQFFDLNERLDTTWGNFFKLRDLWAQPESNHGKGASLFTIFPFITLNLTQIIDLNALSASNTVTNVNNSNNTNNTGGMGMGMGMENPIQMQNLTWNNFSTSNLIPPSTFLGKTLGNYSFTSEIQTTNTINHDLLQFFDGLVINDPEQGFLPKEISDIQNWVNAGGTLYVWAEDAHHSNLTSLNSLLQPFSLQIANNSFFSYKDHKDLQNQDGYYHLNLTISDKINPAHLFDDADQSIHEIVMKDPVEILSLDKSKSTILGKGIIGDKGVIGVSYSGKGRVVVIGDNDLFKENLLDAGNNSLFAQQILRWGQENYYDFKISVSPSTIAMGDQGFADIQLKNYKNATTKGYLSQGLFFVGTYFYENGSMINASLYGIQLPLLPVFRTQEGHYSLWLDSAWCPDLGSYYILVQIDHPVGVSECMYIHFDIVQGLSIEPVQRYEAPPPSYPAYIDQIGIYSIVFMGFLIWFYRTQKNKTRLKITPLKGDYLNIAKTKLNEGRTQFKLMLRGLENQEVEDIEKIRFLLTHQTQLKKFFKDLKKFGENIGEHI